MAPTPPTGLRLVRFAVQALRITASTVALVALVRQQWIAATCYRGRLAAGAAGQRWLPQETAEEPGTPTGS